MSRVEGMNAHRVRPRVRRELATRARVALSCAAILSGLVAAGCEGENLFKLQQGAVGSDPFPPQVSILRPTPNMTVPVEDSVLVEIAISDHTGVVGVELFGEAYRGDPDLGTDEIVPRYTKKLVDLTAAVPQDTVIRRFLVRTLDQTNEFVSIIANVVDVSGNVGSDTVEIYVGGPRVEFVNPAPGQEVRSGRNMAVRLTVADPAGVTGYRLTYDGVVSGTIEGTFSPAELEVVLDTVIQLPAGASGPLTLTATAQNFFGAVGRSSDVVVEVTSQAPPDTTPPQVRLQVTSGQRMELTDSMRITVTAVDDGSGSGLRWIGITALAVDPSKPDTIARRDSVVYTTPRTGTVVAEFSLAPFGIDPFQLPDTISYQLHAVAYDSAGNCAAAVTNTLQQLGCDDSRSFGGQAVTLAANTPGYRADVIVVTGRTVKLPDGGRIADAVVDMERRRLYLSNHARNRVEALDLDQLAFLPEPILVGSQPWGLGLDISGDTLIVANSGGTNIDLVHLNSGTLKRLRTPNLVLHDVGITSDANGRQRYSVTVHDFSDRPQFIAQDKMGRLLYSTRPTAAATPGTVRMLTVPGPNLAPEAYFLFPNNPVRGNENFVALANVDSIQVYFEDSIGDLVRIFTHVVGMAGMPEGVISNPDPMLLSDAVAVVQEQRPDVYMRSGRWDIDAFALLDTTYVAASADRSRVIFGEGAASPFGRVFLWDAQAAELSSGIAVRDLVNNAAERVNGVGLNQDGSLGVLRGRFGAYFFTNDAISPLRLDGMFPTSVDGAGAAMHPSHTEACTHYPPPAERCFAVVGTSRNSVQIIESFHFYGQGEIHIRDNIVGPLRTSPPLPADNNGIPLDDPRRVLFKIYGVTSSGGVVIVDVRRRDITP